MSVLLLGFLKIVKRSRTIRFAYSIQIIPTHLNPNLLTLVALGSFFGGASLGVVLPVGTTLAAKISVSASFPLPSILASRLAALEFEAIDGAGLRLKPKDIATPLVRWSLFGDRCLLLSVGLRNFDIVSSSSGLWNKERNGFK